MKKLRISEASATFIRKLRERGRRPPGELDNAEHQAANQDGRHAKRIGALRKGLQRKDWQV
jgi:hypothetical protein